MKKNIFTLIGMMLILAMTLTAFAVAENTATEDNTDTAGTGTATDEAATDTDENTALQEAYEAYAAAKKSNRVADYEQELKDMVAAGQLTQEQADLLLKAATDAEALADGKCPNCGYEFDTNGRGMKAGYGYNQGKGGRHH